MLFTRSLSLGEGGSDNCNSGIFGIAELRGFCIADGNGRIPGEGYNITFSVPYSRSAIHSFVPSELMLLCGSSLTVISIFNYRVAQSIGGN